MRKKLLQPAFLFITLSILLYSCSKTGVKGPGNSPSPTSITPHKYGLIPMTEDQWKDIPVFTQDIFKSKTIENGLTALSGLPSSYLLTTPAVRDQGQIGSCTGFCGTESNEIVHYYTYTTVTPASSLSVADGISTAVN